MKYTEALEMRKKAADEEAAQKARYEKWRNTLTNLHNAEGQLATDLIGMQMPGIADDAMISSYVNDAGMYKPQLQALIAAMKTRPEGSNDVGFNLYNGKPSLHAYMDTRSPDGHRVPYQDEQLSKQLAKLLAATRTGGVWFTHLDTDNPTVSFFSRLDNNMDEKGFTALDPSERVNYQAPEGMTPVAYDTENLYLRDANGAFSLQPLAKPQVKTAAGSYQQYYNEYMNDPIRKRLRERGGITVPLGLALHGAYVGSRLGPMVQYAVQGGTDEGTIAGALGGSGLGLLAGLMLHRNYRDRQLLKDREDAYRYAKGKLSQNQ